MSKEISIDHLIEKYTLKFFENNVQLENHQRVLIITDDKIDANVAYYLRKSASKMTGHTDICIIPPPTGFDFEPTRELKKKIQKSDVIISPTSFSLFHTQLIQGACDNGAKFFAMTGATLETLYKGAATADFIGLEPKKGSGEIFRFYTLLFRF